MPRLRSHCRLHSLPGPSNVAQRRRASCMRVRGTAGEPGELGERERGVRIWPEHHNWRIQETRMMPGSRLLTWLTEGYPRIPQGPNELRCPAPILSTNRSRQRPPYSHECEHPHAKQYARPRCCNLVYTALTPLVQTLCPLRYGTRRPRPLRACLRAQTTSMSSNTISRILRGSRMWIDSVSVACEVRGQHQAVCVTLASKLI